MTCPLYLVRLLSSLHVPTPQWVPHRQDLPTVCRCMYHLAAQYLQECPLHSDQWALMDLVIRKEHLPECLLRECPLCPAWEVHHPTDFHRRWEYRMMGCHHLLIQQRFLVVVP